jgi:hypothetical protein
VYDHKNPEESLYHAIRSLASNPLLLAKMRQSAFDDCQVLTNPSLAERFWSILFDGGRSALQSGSAAALTWTSESGVEDRQEHHNT